MGMAVTDRFSFGIQVNYVSERIWHSSVAVFGVNIGTIYQLSPTGSVSAQVSSILAPRAV